MEDNKDLTEVKRPLQGTEISENLTYEPQETKVYFKRWIILLIFSYVSFLNAFNWIEHNIIHDVTRLFYNESLPTNINSQNNAVNLLSMVYMLCYIPIGFPAMFLLDRKGLRFTVIFGAALLTIGSIIKCFAINSEYFIVLLAGQTVCAIAESITLSVPARLSALWFGSEQVALATSIGVFGNQLGIAAGFLIPPNLVIIGDYEFMRHRLYYLFISVAFLCFIGLITSIIFIKDQPDIPPSLSQLERRRVMSKIGLEFTDFQLFKTSLYKLISNQNFMLIFFSYGINVGVFYALSTLLNQIISEYYQDANSTIGLFGLIICISGLIGSIIAGLVLDKFKKFKLVAIIFYISSFLSMCLFTATLKVNIYIIFGTSALLGFFMTGYLPVGFELATEITFPESEGNSCGLLNTAAMSFGMMFISIQGRIIGNYGAFYGNLFLCVSLLIGSILTALVKSDLRRQKRGLNDISSGL